MLRRDVAEAVTGGTWLFLGNIVISVTGFVFWVVVARIAGIEAVGVATSVFSAATLFAILPSAGLNIAVMREVAAEGFPAYGAALAVSVMLGTVSALLAIPAVTVLGYGGFAGVAAALAALSVASIATTQGLLGFERFSGFFTAVTAGSLAKLAVGVAAALAGLGALSVLIGYLAYFLVAIAASLLIALTSAASPLRVRGLGTILKLTYSNYPFVISGQLITMLNVYMFAYLVGEAPLTGILYIAFMVMLTVFAVPNALISASLPIGIRRGSDPFSDTLRISLGVVTPIVALVLAAPAAILHLINPALVTGSSALKILVLAIAPMTALIAGLMRLNKEGRMADVAVLGAVRLALLVATLPILAKSYGLEGAAASFLTANIAPLPLLIAKHGIRARELAITWSTHALIALLSLAPIPTPVLAAASLVIATLVTHLLKVLTLGEFIATAKAVVSLMLKRA
ncbi:MAG: hypothetical protein B6U73_04310 [Desulfurococcales archaeon ex4484_204]|nr:MAG: hypothetical protein B6U73_04310 [Desulfurococcales archaeon ex4484_204]